jgi:nicotinate-nucleotide adenylyltransferase
MRITLFGAAFNPPHLGHQQIVVSLIKERLTDAVWLVPVKEHPFGKRLAPAADRLAMTQLLTNSIQAKLSEVGGHTDGNTVRVETFELDEAGISYSFRTLVALTERHPEHQFSFVIGSDNLSTFHKWDQYEAMLAQFPFFVYPRHGFSFDPLLVGMTPMLNMAEVRVSSTQIREKLKTNETIDTLVPTMIAEYIRDRNLYR